MKRLRVAVIGVGYLGRFHAQKYAGMADVDLAGVVDVDPTRAAEVAREVGTEPYASMEPLAGIDAVSIAVPTSLHAEVAIPLLESGTAVLLEKPIAATTEEAAAIIDAAHRGGTILQIGHLERFNPALLELKDSIRDPMFIEAHRISPFKARGTDVDVVLDIMIHDLDIILALVGSPVASMEAVGVPVLTDAVDIANARLRFETGCIANITASRVSADVMRKIRIFQKDAYISLDFAKSKADVYTLSETRQIGHRHLAISESDALAGEIRSFIDAVAGGGSVVVDGTAGLNALQMAYAIKNCLVVPKR
ncbi:MAG TPA: Gfo/Idh/MocA family oxidoreductase [Deltaproteobacteria bacterium]|nr:Gfo/Idh/MocA family oxidoreductase [Deltaproteobacteria bacterium]HPR55109.1 Gfo/Idh/MocA family oxidoreductase [Deltaproteobacteria bacterium]HXK47309.1 Gfo/Idh/MocA family oxidoreductase [Deltaproteobacteria bacterium]